MKPVESPPRRDRSVVDLAREAVADAVGVEGRLWRTLAALVGSPGRLTEAYLDGSEGVYLRPTRVYLLTSLVLFALVKLADPGQTLRDALLAQEQAWLASGEPEANAELVSDLEWLRQRFEAEARDASQMASRLDTLRAAAQEGRARDEGAEVFIATARGRLTDRRFLQRDPTEEDLAIAQSAIAGRILEWLPVAIILLVPLYALGLHVVLGSSGIGALVMAIHAHAVAFGLLALAVIAALVAPVEGGQAIAFSLIAGLVALAGSGVWQVLALRRVFGVGWGRAVGALAWGGAYLVGVAVVFAVLYGLALTVV